MPCAIAIIQYVQCEHSILYKLGCTENYESLCLPAQQETLLITKSLWSCEDCLTEAATAEENAKADDWDDRALQVALAEEQWNSLTPAAKATSAPGTIIRPFGFSTLRKRQEREEKAMEKRRETRVEETQRMADWTAQYGDVLWKLSQDVYSGDSGDERLSEANSLIKVLRASRPWDLVVVRDASRTDEELLDEQWEYHLVTRPGMSLLHLSLPRMITMALHFFLSAAVKV